MFNNNYVTFKLVVTYFYYNLPQLIRTPLQKNQPTLRLTPI